MNEPKWKPQLDGTWEARDSDGNRWFRSAGKQVYLVDTPTGNRGVGLSPRQALADAAN